MSKVNKYHKGFTLIELVVAFSILAILSTIGIASFLSYSRSQALQTAVNDFSSVLSLARSRSLSQVKPPQCISQRLNGYTVSLSFSDNSYQMDANCSTGSYRIISNKLPANITFNSQRTTSSTFFFPIITGGAQSGTIVMNGYDGTEKTITITSTGGIQMPNPNPPALGAPTSTPTPTIGPTPTPIPPPAPDSIHAVGAVWNDSNRNGVKDVGESNTSGLGMRLLGPPCTGEYSASLTTTSSSPNNYQFLNAPVPSSCTLVGPGSAGYSLALTIPSGFEYSGGLSGCLAFPSPGATGEVSCYFVASSGTSYTFNFGIRSR